MKRKEILASQTVPAEHIRARIEREPLPANILALVSEASREGGDTPVWHFIDTGETITYAELEPRIRALAAGFWSLGITKGTHVAVMLPNVAAMPLTWLALGSLGAVMVPLNVSYSEREIEYVLDNSDATHVVSDHSFIGILQNTFQRGKVRIDAKNIILAGAITHEYASLDRHLATDASSAEIPAGVDHDTLMNIQYTSGTTGFPKGCMLPQRYWLSAGKVNAFRDGRAYRRIFASTPFYYMDPQWLLLMTLYQRATLYVAARQSASRFVEWLRTYEIEFCLLPFIVAKQPSDPRDSHNAVIRANIYGAPSRIHFELEERFDLCAREAFGMTELGPTLFMPLEAEDMIGSGSCGIPCPFRECRIADENGGTVPPGGVGELVVRGPGIMKGYYKRPDATAAAFHGEWFRTGDLFRRDERGYFYIVGRIKDSIRRSGENIAAREVETVLGAHPDVAEVAVVPVKDEIRGEEIKALIVWKEGMAGSQQQIEALIELCTQNLAPFKVPRYFESRRSLPKTGSSKIAKHVLTSEAVAPDALVFDRLSKGDPLKRVSGNG